MFKHINSKRRNKLTAKKLNDLVFVHYNLRFCHKQILGTDTSPIVLEKIDIQAEWSTEVDDPVFNDDDLEWVDQVAQKAKVVAMALKRLKHKET